MTASLNYVAIPLIGYENIVQISDSGVLRPVLSENGNPGAYIMPNTIPITDGSGNNADVVPSSGRSGNMKTVILAELTDDPESAGIVDLFMLVNLPSAMRGLVPQRFTNSTQWLNTANWPIVDYSKLAPICSIRPVEFPIEANKATATNPFIFDPATPWSSFVTAQAGMQAYYPAGWESDAVFNPASTYSNVGEYGAVLCRFYLEAGGGDGFTPGDGDIVEISVDFSHTIDR